MLLARKSYPLYPFEPIEASPTYKLSTFEKKVESLLTKGYPVRPDYLFKLDTPLPWAHEERTVCYLLHSFEPIAPLLMAYSITGRLDCLELSLQFLKGWIEQVHPPTKQELSGKWRELEKKDYIWYDMAVGLRSYRLAFIIDCLFRIDSTPKSYLGRLMEILEWHREIMSRDLFFSGHNNHGLYQALGQIAMARRFLDIPAMKDALHQGQERLDIMLKQQFFESGIHKEHSPGYHWMILGTLKEAANVGLISSSKHLNLIHKVEEIMSWWITPNLSLPAFGDTDSGGIQSEYYKAQDFAHPQLRFSLSRGTIGLPHSENLKVWKEEGYAIIKKMSPKYRNEGSYLAQLAGFHSRTHKHADHLTFVWHDKNTDIIVDAGRFGYKGKTEQGSELWKDGFWYSDPKRIYVEKTRAHNTVEIDGLDFQRKGSKCFGSALRRSAQVNNTVYAIESECKHFNSIRHVRVLFNRPDNFLIVFDWLKDNHDKPHDYKQYFHLGKDVDLKTEDENLDFFSSGQKFASVVPLLGSSIKSLIRAQMEPNLEGWISHEKGGILIPSWSFSYGASHRPQAMFATLFSLNPDIEPWGKSEVAPSGQSGKLIWKDSVGYHHLSFKRRPNEEFKLKYDCKTNRVTS